MVEIIGGKMCFSAGGGAIYSTDDPFVGHWTKIADLHGAADVDLFQDDEGRVYLYYGCSDKTPLYGEELNPKQGFKTIRGPVELVMADRAAHGWQVKRGADRRSGSPAQDRDDPQVAPWVEGSWMNKVGGRYYLQFAAPGTELNSYADGAAVGDHPLGPFIQSPANPVSFRPTGFARGAGHGSTFRDARGNYWHITTQTIAKRNMFERRLDLFPVKFSPDGQMACNTYLGDYPQYLPGTSADPFRANSPGWMLLSLNRPVEASSTLPGFPADLACDESIQTWWSAATGSPNEWLKVDLGSVATIQALQIDFADEGSTTLGRLENDAYRYLVEVSNDGHTWRTLIDRRDNQRDAPQDFTQLTQPTKGRYVRLINLHTPAGARFSVSGLRVFGNTVGPAPKRVGTITAHRDPTDGRRAHLEWTPTHGAEFYIIRYGIRPDRLFTDYQVYGATSLDLNSLNAGVAYYVAVDAINANGITSGPRAVPIR